MKSNKNLIFEDIRKFALANSEQDDIHGFPHTQRVYNQCIKIGERLDADLKILKTAALLHDIGRKNENTDQNKRNHAEISSTLTRTYLESLGTGYSQEEIDKIVHCIRAHSFSNKIKPLMLEAKILSDADKLDALGAIGLYRTIGFTIKNRGGIKQVISHLENKILRLKDTLYLDESKIIAEQKHKLIVEFYTEITDQLKEKE
jgi:uncharacterized protein